ncbi:kinase-like domain-containing protein [Rhizophagus clarus]|uniref:Kinase-like domain-containing protein n=1 Tax=Rhizophagus clarus TaxID=94130 RepID=A0A8H3KSQ7_9GLOM|nr:kinase-like domain-containing protein [Rhizophagus clarus]
MFLENLYTKVFPNLRGRYRLMESKFHDNRILLEFEPVGYKTIPETGVKLREAIYEVLDFVKKLHVHDILRSIDRGGNDECKEAGDNWMICNLMNDSRIRFDLSESARNFRDKLTCRNPENRLTAVDALKDEWFNDM